MGEKIGIKFVITFSSFSYYLIKQFLESLLQLTWLTFLISFQPFDLKEIDIMVSFPDNYPLEVNTTVFKITSSFFCALWVLCGKNYKCFYRFSSWKYLWTRNCHPWWQSKNKCVFLSMSCTSAADAFVSTIVMICRHVQDASVEWLQAKHATNQLLGKVELLFRPFLRWLDRSLERLFTEGARQVRRHHVFLYL